MIMRLSLLLMTEAGRAPVTPMTGGFTPAVPDALDSNSDHLTCLCTAAPAVGLAHLRFLVNGLLNGQMDGRGDGVDAV